MFDYNTVKLGWYFYSNEIIERLNLFGGASINSSKDLDLFYIFEFRRFFPTVFAEVYYLTRNIQETNKYSVYSLDDRLRFRLTQFDIGLRFPLYGLGKLELFSSWQQYRAFIKEKVLDISGLEAGVAYDYYKGLISGVRLSVNGVKRLLDSNINVAFGHDCVMDPWYSLGKHDMLDAANMALHVGQMTSMKQMQQMFQAITSNGAKVMQLDNYGIEVGCNANLVVHQANNPIEAIRLRNARLFVIRNGQVIAKANPIQSELLLDAKKVTSVIDWTL